MYPVPLSELLALIQGLRDRAADQKQRFDALVAYLDEEAKARSLYPHGPPDYRPWVAHHAAHIAFLDQLAESFRIRASHALSDVPGSKAMASVDTVTLQMLHGFGPAALLSDLCTPPVRIPTVEEMKVMCARVVGERDPDFADWPAGAIAYVPSEDEYYDALQRPMGIGKNGKKGTPEKPS
jgi:hypothetical protein